MARLEIPIAHQILSSTGDVKLWADIGLLLKDQAGNFVPETFRVDTGTQITTFPAHLAKGLNLPIPQAASPGAIQTPTGLEIRSGILRFRIDGMGPDEYQIACLFLGDPDTPPDPGQPATFPRKLFQPFQLLDRLRFTADKDPMTGSLYGDLLIETK
jgi:hypothetical protein